MFVDILGIGFKFGSNIRNIVRDGKRQQTGVFPFPSYGRQSSTSMKGCSMAVLQQPEPVDWRKKGVELRRRAGQKGSNMAWVGEGKVQKWQENAARRAEPEIRGLKQLAGAAEPLIFPSRLRGEQEASIQLEWAANSGEETHTRRSGQEVTSGLPRELSSLCALVKSVWNETSEEPSGELWRIPEHNQTWQHWESEVPLWEEWGQELGGDVRPDRKAPYGALAGQGQEVSWLIGSSSPEVPRP